MQATVFAIISCVTSPARLPDGSLTRSQQRLEGIANKLSPSLGETMIKSIGSGKLGRYLGTCVLIIFF